MMGVLTGTMSNSEFSFASREIELLTANVRLCRGSSVTCITLVIESEEYNCVPGRGKRKLSGRGFLGLSQSGVSNSLVISEPSADSSGY
jgi:hypothetical protein